MAKTVAAFFGPKQILIYSSIVYLTAFVVYFWYEKSDPQGEANSSCIKEELQPVASGLGQTVTGHRTLCDVMGGNSAVYIYIHKQGESDGRSSLVFRYEDLWNVGDPKIEWVDSSSVRITVREVAQVSKRLPITKDGIRVSYEIGKENYPPSL